MDATALKLLAGLTFIVTGFAGLWLLRGKAPMPAKAPGRPAPALPSRQADRVLDGYRGRLRAIQERSRFSAQSFERDCLQLVRRVATHPFSSAADNGMGLLLDQTYHALGYRQSILLPPNAAAEDIEPRSFRWTFGLIVASMLSGLRSNAAVAGPWVPGDLQASLAPWLDTETLHWLLQDELLVEHLNAFFASAHGSTPFHMLVANGRKAALGVQAPAPDAAAVMPTPVPERVIDEATLSVATPALPADEPAPVATPLLSGTVLANDFMQWLAGGIAAQTLAVNAPGASVHFVADGMVLAAPGIFQEYAAHRVTQEAGDIATVGKQVQKAVCAEGWHLRGPQNAALHRFKVVGGGDDRSVVTLKAVVISTPQRFVAAVPPPNAALSRLM